MINKDVCKKCIDHLAVRWNSNDEERWLKRYVFCVGLGDNDVKGETVNIYDPPPGWCPYAFEHAVAAGSAK